MRELRSNPCHLSGAKVIFDLNSIIIYDLKDEAFQYVGCLCLLYYRKFTPLFHGNFIVLATANWYNTFSHTVFVHLQMRRKSWIRKFI